MNDYEYSENELRYIAAVAYQQLKATTPNNVFYSWGVSKIMFSMCNNLPALALRVNARLLQGVLFVALNEGKDLYELYTLQNGTSEPKLVAEDLYSDMLGDEIDRIIERGDNWEEYEAFCREEEKHLYDFIFG